LKSFILQNPEQMFKDLPVTKTIVNGISELGHKLNVLITGAGRRSSDESNRISGAGKRHKKRK